MMIIILILLALIVLGLGIYLGVLLGKIKQQKIKENQMQDKLLSLASEREVFLKDSIITISRAAVQNQCELSEACIRVYELLKNYPELGAHEEYSVIRHMYEALSDFPYLAERQKLSKQERFVQDTKRFQVEEKFRSEVVKSLDLLILHFNA
jgi:hypothetical protein